MLHEKKSSGECYQRNFRKEKKNFDLILFKIRHTLLSQQQHIRKQKYVLINKPLSVSLTSDITSITTVDTEG